MMEKQVSILGCGWLGYPLAKHLIQNGWSVKGSTTSASKLAELNSAEIIPFLIELKEEQIIGEVEEFLKDSGLLIINIPPGLRTHPKSDFVSKLKFLIDEVLKSSVQHVLYVSSTGVFQDHESLPTFTEHYQFTKQEIQNNQLVQAEQLILNTKQLKSSIIRFGGLIGDERHPIKYLSSKTGIKNPEAPVNLIHLDNCIKLMSEIIQQKKSGMTFHGVEDMKTSKKDYYLSKAKEYNLPAPEFDDDSNSEGKKISMEWTKKELGIDLKRKV